jgi:hypothetical protein
VDVLWVSPKAILVLAPKSASFTVPVSTSTFPPFISLQYDETGRQRLREDRNEEIKSERDLNSGVGV